MQTQDMPPEEERKRMNEAHENFGFPQVILRFGTPDRRAVTIARRPKYPETRIGKPASENSARHTG